MQIITPDHKDKQPDEPEQPINHYYDATWAEYIDIQIEQQLIRNQFKLPLKASK